MTCTAEHTKSRDKISVFLKILILSLPCFVSELVQLSLLGWRRGGEVGKGGEEEDFEFSNMLFIELTFTAGT